MLQEYGYQENGMYTERVHCRDPIMQEQLYNMSSNNALRLRLGYLKKPPRKDIFYVLCCTYGMMSVRDNSFIRSCTFSGLFYKHFVDKCVITGTHAFHMSTLSKYEAV